MLKYRNTGAPFPRDDGSVWARGQIAEPTEDELMHRRYKLRAITLADLPETEWTLKMPPEQYLRLHPTGPHASRARALLVVAPMEERAEPEEDESVGTDDGSTNE